MNVNYGLSEKELKRLIEWNENELASHTNKKLLEHLYQNYLPFIKIDDVNSMSRRHLYYCPIQKRFIHLLSDGEARGYKLEINKPDVLGIREQFPLNLLDTIRISKEQNAPHPRNWKTNEIYIMTTDLLVDRVNFETGEVFQEAINFKYWDQIYEYDESGLVVRKQWRTWQKAAIEEAYWLEKGVKTIQMTERDASKVAVQNITWFLMRKNLGASQADVSKFKQAFISSYLSNTRGWLEAHLMHASKILGLSFKDVQALFQFTACHHELDINIELPIRLSEPLVVNL